MNTEKNITTGEAFSVLSNIDITSCEEATRELAAAFRNRLSEEIEVLNKEIVERENLKIKLIKQKTFMESVCLSDTNK